MHEQTTSTSPGIAPDAPRARFLNAARVILIAPGNTGLYLNQRSAGSGPDPGLWQAPGGKLEPNEPALLGALRELEEEAGIRLSPGDLTPFDVEVYEHADGTIVQVYLFTHRLAPGILPVNMEPDKAGDYRLVTWDALRHYPLVRSLSQSRDRLRWKFNTAGAVLDFVKRLGREMLDIRRRGETRGAFGRHAKPVPGTPHMAHRRKNPFRGCCGGTNLPKHYWPVIRVPRG